MSPDISVIIPVYNTELYLRECLDSIIGQTLTNIEIICIDDGSTDNSQQILLEYAAKDKRINLVRSENFGVSHARNLALDLAKGEYICFVDSDDYIEFECLERLKALAKANNADIVVFGGKSFPVVNEWADNAMNPRSTIYRNNSIMALFREKGCKPLICGKLYRRSLLFDNKIKFCEELKLGEDQAFQFQVFPLSKIVVFTESKFYYYRQRPSSSMARYNENKSKKLEGHLRLVEKIYITWKDSGYLSENSSALLEWMINFLYYDLMQAKYDLKVKGCKLLNDIIQKNLNNTFSKELEDKVNNIRSIAENQYLPIISVIIPVYNTAKYLPECISTLSKQSFLNFEMIFVDDGSTDMSLSILKEFANSDARVTVLSQDHQFAGVARNLGIKYAKGKYLLFLDSDDFFEPQMLELVYRQIKCYSADICVFGARGFDQQTRCFTSMPWVCNTSRCPDKNKTFSLKDNSKFIFAFTTAAPWNKLFRREFIQQYNIEFQAVRSANDAAFVLTALALADSIIVMDKILINYRINNSQSLQGSQDKNPLSFYDALLEIRHRLKIYGIYEQTKQAFIVFALDCCLYNLGTLKSKKAFEKVFFFLKKTAFSKLEIEGKESTYFYAYTANNYQRFRDISQLSVLEYIEKYNLFEMLGIKTVEKRNKIDDLIAENKFLHEEIKNIKNSASFKVGRFITFIPRKVRGGIRCYQEHGLHYTIGRIKYKLKRLLGVGK